MLHTSMFIGNLSLYYTNEARETILTILNDQLVTTERSSSAKTFAKLLSKYHGLRVAFVFTLKARFSQENLTLCTNRRLHRLLLPRLNAGDLYL